MAPINNIEDVMKDPQYKARGAIISIEDDELGTIRTHNIPFHLSETPGKILWTGPALRKDNYEIYGTLGMTKEEINNLQDQGVL